MVERGRTQTKVLTPAYADPQESIFRGFLLLPSVWSLAKLVENLPGRRESALSRSRTFPPHTRRLQGPSGCPLTPPLFTQRINHALCSHSLYTERSLLAVCYDLHVVCKSCPQINFCCSSWKAVCFVNNLTHKDAETAAANARMESSIMNKQENKGHQEQNEKYQHKSIIIRKDKNEVVQ